MKHTLTILIALILLAACTSAPTATPTAAPTVILPPTATFTPTQLPTATSTATLTATPRATDTPRPTNTPRPPTLRELADKLQTKLGILVLGQYLNDKRYTDIAPRDFNLVILDYWVQWSNVEPQRDRWDFAQADRLVSWARKNNMEILAQPLCWHQFLPDWVLRGNFSQDELKGILYNHAFKLANHYRNDISLWVAVNEAQINPDNRGKGYDWWFDKLGSEYMAICFKAARDANPNATLLYSQLGGETTQNRTDVIASVKDNRLAISMIKDAGFSNIGIGLHGRFIGIMPPDKTDMIASFRSYGVPVYLTEITVDMTGVQGTLDEVLKKQADIYRDVASACIESGVCKSMAVFGFRDSDSFLVTDRKRMDSRAMLFDDNYNPKPAYFALRDVLAGK
jgi:endo-1,4-beta-xylanase